MTNPLPLPQAERSSTETDYQPISGLAIAAIVVSGLFVLIASFTAAIAVWNKRPVLNVWLLGLAVLGLILSIAARIHVRQAEGTRTGARLAAIAWWMSILGGAGLGAYMYASVFVLREQSEKVAFDFLELLKKDRINDAFIQTIPPLQRPKNLDELEGRFGSYMLPTFRGSELVRLFMRNGKDVKVSSLGMRSWEQVDTGYRTEMSFRLSSAEGVSEVNFALTGAEGPNIIGREWNLTTEGGLIPKVQTTYGRLVLELQHDAGREVGEWLNHLGVRNRERAYLFTLQPAARAERENVLLAKQAAAGLLSVYLPWGKSTLPPDRQAASGSDPRHAVANELLDREFFVLEGGKLLTEDSKKTFRELWYNGMMLPTGASRMQNAEKTPILTITPEEIVCRYPIEIAMPTLPLTYSKAWLELVSTNPALLQELQVLHVQGLANPDQADMTKGEPLRSRPGREWRLRRIETSLEPLQAPPQPRG